MYIFEELKSAITDVISDAEVHILDPREDGIHLEAIVISDAFVNVPLVKQHKMVMNALKEFFETTLHALALKTYTKEKWRENGNQA